MDCRREGEDEEIHRMNKNERYISPRGMSGGSE